MLPVKYAVGLAVVLAAGLLPTRVAVCSEGAGQAPAASGEQWDDGEPVLGGRLGEVAFQPPGDGGPPRGPGYGPPPPPRDRDDDRPPPPRRERGPDGDRRPPPGPPRDGDHDRPPPPLDREGRPMRGAQPGMGLGLGGPISPLPEHLRNNPEMLELLTKDGRLDHETHELAMQYRRAAKEQQEKIKQQVEELVNKQFEVRQERRSLELKRVEEQLQHLRDAVSRREKARKELIEKRVSELLGLGKELDF